MKRTWIGPRLYVIFISLCFLSVKCTVPSLTPTPVVNLVTSTDIPELSPTRTPTATGTPTPPPTPISLPSTRMPSPTPAPTMTKNEEHTFVSRMIQDNGGCRLPCWWGFTPGETELQTIRDFFLSRGVMTKLWTLEGSSNYTVYFTDNLSTVIQNYGGQKGLLDMISLVGNPPVRNEEYVYGDPQFTEVWEPYLPPQLLENYGPPEEVFLGADLWSPLQFFDLLIFYPQQGFLVQYSGPLTEQGDQLRVCPSHAEIHLDLWNPGSITRLKDVAGIEGYTYSPEDHSLLRSLAEATGMSTTEFIEEMSQPGNCIETPKEVWQLDIP